MCMVYLSLIITCDFKKSVINFEVGQCLGNTCALRLVTTCMNNLEFDPVMINDELSALSNIIFC